MAQLKFTPTPRAPQGDVIVVEYGDDPAAAAVSINTTFPLTGGGDLHADRTLDVAEFDATNPGVVPASGGSSTDVLHADGSWSAAGGSANISIDEAPTGTINGINDTFTLANTPTGGIFLYVSSISKCWSGVTYNLTGATIVFTAGNIPQTGDLISATYTY